VKFPTYVKEMFLDSDTKVAVLSGAPSDLPQDWMLSNDAIRDACDRVNGFAGSQRMLGHFIFTPGQPGWLDAIDHGIGVLKPAGWKGYTIGDNTHKDISRYPWLMDDEQLTYKGYKKFDKAGIRIVAVHKGLFPPSDEAQFPNLTRYAKVDDVGTDGLSRPRTPAKQPCLWVRAPRLDRVSPKARIPVNPEERQGWLHVTCGTEGDGWRGQDDVRCSLGWPWRWVAAQREDMPRSSTVRCHGGREIWSRHSRSAPAPGSISPRTRQRQSRRWSTG
jgi:hypothetical protein